MLDDSAQRCIFDCRQSLSNGIEASGVYLMTQNTTSFIGYRAASGIVGSNESSNRYIKVAAVYEKGVLKAIYRRGNNGLGELIKTDITNGEYVAHSAPLILGGGWGWSATVNTPQYVKVNRFYIFDHALSVGEVAEYLPETNYTVSEFSPVWSDNASYNTNVTTGEVVSGTNWLTLDAIELPESAVGLRLKVNDSECQYLGCTQYDESMTFVRRTEVETGDYEVVFDRATKFIRVSAFPNHSGTGVISRVTAEFLCEEE
ncbi:MAG: hypothetical protein UHE62_00940 [Muribaculaceae bacterium]|nr:hypothetical protein [Muribaculaceae bacterium]